MTLKLKIILIKMEEIIISSTPKSESRNLSRSKPNNGNQDKPENKDMNLDYLDSPKENQNPLNSSRQNTRSTSEYQSIISSNNALLDSPKNNIPHFQTNVDRNTVRPSLASFERVMQNLQRKKEKHLKHTKKDALEFYQRNLEYQEKRNNLAKQNTPEYQIKSNPKSLKIAEKAEQRRKFLKESEEQKREQERNAQRKVTLDPRPANVNPKFTLAKTSELSVHIKQLRQQISEIQQYDEIMNNENRYIQYKHHVSPFNRKLASRAEARRKQLEEERSKAKTPKVDKARKFYHKTPDYLVDVTNVIMDLKRTDRDIRQIDE